MTDLRGTVVVITGGSSGVGFLQRALDLTFFPELYSVRTEIGR